MLGRKRITDEEHWGSSVLVGLSTYPGRRHFSHGFLWLCRHKKQREKRRLPRYVKRPLWAQNWKTNDYRTEEKYERCTLRTLTLSDLKSQPCLQVTNSYYDGVRYITIANTQCWQLFKHYNDDESDTRRSGGVNTAPEMQAFWDLRGLYSATEMQSQIQRIMHALHIKDSFVLTREHRQAEKERLHSFIRYYRPLWLKFVHKMALNQCGTKPRKVFNRDVLYKIA